MTLDRQSLVCTDLPTPAAERYFEDYVPGSVCEYGSIRLEEADILAFARQYDPQYIHLDPAKAVHGPFGGLIASGWQTAGVMMRLLADNFVSQVANMGSPGIDELRWLRPVRPGDSLSVRITIQDAHRSRSKPDRGIVRSFVEVLNQRGEVVMNVKSLSMIRCRSHSAVPTHAKPACVGSLAGGAPQQFTPARAESARAGDHE